MSTNVRGFGITHYPSYGRNIERLFTALRFALDDPDLPESLRTSEGWPQEMRAEWGDDEGQSSAVRHKQALTDGFLAIRAALDEFEPDVVLLWGDDQYEQFREDIVPPFTVFCADEYVFRPWLHGPASPNMFNEPRDTEHRVAGAPDVGRELTSRLMDLGFDMPYATAVRADRPFPHSIANSVMYLDGERRGFPYAVLPIAVNCYGRQLLRRQGGMARLADIVHDSNDPPAPSPARCFDLGAAIARSVTEMDARVALVASSSWSHAFLHDRAYHLYPDGPADRQLYGWLERGEYKKWRDWTLTDIENSGQQELLNWFCLAGAAAELGWATQWSTLVETSLFNSNKCFAVLA